MISEALRGAVLSRVSTGRILANAADLETLDRHLGGPGLEEALGRLAARLGEANLEVSLSRHPYGLEHSHFSWSLPRRPFPVKAELWLVPPSGDEVLICRRADNLACFMGSLRSTEETGEVFQVVDVGFGTRPNDYRGHRLAGKVALCSGHRVQAAMLEALTSRRAAGLLCGPGDAGEDPTRVPPNTLAAPEIFDGHQPFGFNLSARQYSRLLDLLAAEGAVQVRVKLEVITDSGELPALSATLTGGDLQAERVLLVGDASQALTMACLQEVAQVAARLVTAGECAPPRRSLQLLLCPGPAGAVAWMHARKADLGAVRAAALLDLQTPGAAADVLLHRAPLACRSFSTDLLEDHLRWAANAPSSFRTDLPLSYRGVSCRGAAPTLPWADTEIGLPVTWIEGVGEPRGGSEAPHGPLHRLTAGLACGALDLCGLGDADLSRLLASGHLKGQRRLVQLGEAWQARIQRLQEQEAMTPRAARDLLWQLKKAADQALDSEHLTLDSACDFLEGAGPLALRLAEVKEELGEQRAGLGRSLQAEVAAALSPQARARLAVGRAPLTARERRADALVPRRLFSGPLPAPQLLRLARPEDRPWLADNERGLRCQPPPEELLRWADGERTLLGVYDQLRAEYPEADLKLFKRLAEVLQGAGLVELAEDTKISSPQPEGVPF